MHASLGAQCVTASIWHPVNRTSDGARRAAPGRRKMGSHQPEEIIMQRRVLPAAALILACLSLAACREHNEPVKPIADLSASVAVASASAR